MAPIADPDALLAELAQAGQAQAPSGDEVAASTLAMRQRVISQANAGRAGLKHLRYTHEDCIDRILTTPGISQNDLAQMYGVTAAWMSIVVNCDAFKVKLAERREELIDPVLAASLNERYGALASRSVEVLLEKLSKPADEISDKLALEAAALGARAVGMGEPKPSGPTNAADHLAALAHRLIDLNRQPAPAIDVPSRRVA